MATGSARGIGGNGSCVMVWGYVIHSRHSICHHQPASKSAKNKIIHPHPLNETKYAKCDMNYLEYSISRYGRKLWRQRPWIFARKCNSKMISWERELNLMIFCDEWRSLITSFLHCLPAPHNRNEIQEIPSPVLSRVPSGCFWYCTRTAAQLRLIRQLKKELCFNFEEINSI